MQSLLLATSLVVTSPASITNMDTEATLNNLITQEVTAVSEVVLDQTELATKDNYLLQAKLAIQAARVELAGVSNPQNVVAE